MKLEDIQDVEQFRCDDGKYRYIYKILLTETNEYYYGQHTTDDIYDGYMGSGNEVRKYYELSGFTNVDKDYVCFVNNQDELNAKEREYIGIGYDKDTLCLNKTPGGFGGWENINRFYTSEQRSNDQREAYNNKTDEYKENYKKKCKTNFNNWLSSITEDEYTSYRNHISMGLNKFHQMHPGVMAGENNPMFGHTHTKESRIKMSNSKNGMNNNRYGAHWYYNPQTLESVSLMPYEKIPSGFIRGRKCKRRKI